LPVGGATIMSIVFAPVELPSGFAYSIYSALSKALL
jgi:hypothetical protein